MRHSSKDSYRILHQTDPDSRSELRSNHSAPRQSSCNTGLNIFQHPGLNSRASVKMPSRGSFNDQLKGDRRKVEARVSERSSYSKPPLSQTNIANLVQAEPKVVHSSSVAETQAEKRLKQVKLNENYENLVSIPRSSYQSLCYLCRDPLNPSSRYQTPKCKQHYFCFSCIHQRVKTNRSEFCNNCLQYLSCIAVEPGEKSLRCNLCPTFPKNSILNCKKHQYCATCLDFLRSNSHKHLVNLSNCSECLSDLDYMKNLSDRAQVQHHLKEAEFCGIQAKRHSKEAEIPEIKTRPLSSRFELSGLPTRQQLKHSEKFKTQSRTDFKEKTCEIQSKLEKNLETQVESHSKLAETSLLPTSPKKSSKPLTNPSLFKLSFNEVKSESSPESLQEISSPNLSKSIDLSVSCTNCQGFNNIRGFLCNHNLCVFCLNLACLSDITKFFQQYQVDHSIIKNDFFYKCPVQTCSHPISVPTLMLLNDHFTLLKEKNYREAMKAYSYVTFESVGPWVSYFDGLSSWCIFE